MNHINNRSVSPSPSQQLSPPSPLISSPLSPSSPSSPLPSHNRQLSSSTNSPYRRLSSRATVASRFSSSQLSNGHNNRSPLKVLTDNIVLNNNYNNNNNVMVHDVPLPIANPITDVSDLIDAPTIAHCLMRTPEMQDLQRRDVATQRQLTGLRDQLLSTQRHLDGRVECILDSINSSHKYFIARMNKIQSLIEEVEEKVREIDVCTKLKEQVFGQNELVINVLFTSQSLWSFRCSSEQNNIIQQLSESINTLEELSVQEIRSLFIGFGFELIYQKTHKFHEYYRQQQQQLSSVSSSSIRTNNNDAIENDLIFDLVFRIDSNDTPIY